MNTSGKETLGAVAMLGIVVCGAGALLSNWLSQWLGQAAGCLAAGANFRAAQFLDLILGF